MTTACSVATAACAAATLLCIPRIGPPGPPGIGIQGPPGKDGQSSKGDKGDNGDTGPYYFTQSGPNIIYNQGNLIVQDNFNDNIVNLSNSLNAQSGFYNNIEFHKDIVVDGNKKNANLTNTINSINNNLNPLVGNNCVVGTGSIAASSSTINGANINIGGTLSNVFINGTIYLNGSLLYRAQIHIQME